MSAHSNSVCIRYRGACCNEGAYSVGVLVIIKKTEGAHKGDGTLNGTRALNRIITVICIFIILYIIRIMITVNYHYHHYHHYHHRYYFFFTMIAISFKIWYPVLSLQPSLCGEIRTVRTQFGQRQLKFTYSHR